MTEIEPKLNSVAILQIRLKSDGGCFNSKEMPRPDCKFIKED